MMIDVSFYTEMSLASRTRRVAFPRTATAVFHRQIEQAMRGSEQFACYRTPEGPVYALDRDGVVARV